MSWHYSRALEAAYSEANSLDGEPSARLKSSLTLAPCSWPDRTMEACQRSQSGTMCAPSMADRGEGLLTWFLEVSRARTSARRERASASAASEADCGAKWPESWVKFDPATCSWKTRQLSLTGDLEPCSEIWPNWGIMRDGECWALATPDWITRENAHGLWPTPLSASKSRGRGGLDGGSHARKKLRRMVSEEDAKAMCAKHKVNPEWLELLMGWPRGWTALQPLETARLHQWSRSHGQS